MKQTAEQVKEQASAWAEGNPDMWRAFVDMALTFSAQGKQWSARGIAEALRWSGEYQRAYGSQFKIPNAITPVLGRMVCEKHPEVEPWFRRSHSKVDK